MKKTKKFDDGGPTGGSPIGGRYVDSGDGQIFVPDTSAPVADTPVAASVSPRQLGPISGGIAGIKGNGRPMSAGLAPVLSDPAGGFTEGQNLEPVGRMMPPLRSQDRADINMVGRFDSGMTGQAAMKKGGAVKKTTKVVKAKTATVRGHGIEQRGKTKGRFV